jgi:hypothetical protein
MLKGRLFSRRKEGRKEQTRTRYLDNVVMGVRGWRRSVEGRAGWRRIVKEVKAHKGLWWWFCW